MKTSLICAALLSFGALAWGDSAMPQQAVDVWKASGGENWPKVKKIRFTFVVEADGKQVASAKHIWDVAAGTDEVEWKDKHATADLKNPPQDGDAKAAYGRWVNDSYWLLAPLKLRDPGVNVASEGTKELNGNNCEVL